MIKAIIIDDEPLARSVINEYLIGNEQISIIEECNDGFEGLKAIQQHQPDLIFLDIQMPKINGFEMLELLDKPLQVIFTTAFDEYAIKAFEMNAIDYLLKPFSKERFDKATEKAVKQIQATGILQNDFLQNIESPAAASRVVVKTGSKIKIIPVHDINFLEAADDYVKIHTEEGTFLKNKTMAFFEKSLSASSFVRTHRSYMINISGITRIDHHEKDNYVAVLKNGIKIPVSKSGYTKLKELLGI